MTRFGETIDGLARYRRTWQAMADAAGGLARPGAEDLLAEVAEFGPNPGQLRMLQFVPDGLPRGAALVVVLHGCSQTAGGYEFGAGWSELAEKHGFALLCPEQQRANNPNLCFNWFQPGDVTRGQGEVESIRRMIDGMVQAHALDRDRVFITGLSAGGAMTAAMLATYPELFAGGAIIAGLPYGAAGSVQEALESMRSVRPRPAEDWAALVRAASPARDRWPRLSVWHGTADTTVAPANAEAIVMQWRALVGLPGEPSLAEAVDGATRRVWRDRRGRAVLEAFTIPGLGHGTPIAPSLEDPTRRCGTAGPFLLDAGIPSTRHIAAFWGLLRAERRTAAEPARPAPEAPRPEGARPRLEERLISKVNPAEVLGAVRGMDPGGVIHRALRAAGLLKGGEH
jgi:feruloyl esterase